MSRGNPSIMYAPDLSEYSFNKMLGLGDEEYNRLIRESREKKRESRRISDDMNLWNIWELYS